MKLRVYQQKLHLIENQRLLEADNYSPNESAGTVHVLCEEDDAEK
jgi:hypothetical protein